MTLCMAARSTVVHLVRLLSTVAVGRAYVAQCVGPSVYLAPHLSSIHHTGLYASFGMFLYCLCCCFLMVRLL